MTKEECEKFFEQHGESYFESYAWGSPRGLKIEALYQAFKIRMEMERTNEKT